MAFQRLPSRNLQLPSVGRVPALPAPVPRLGTAGILASAIAPLVKAFDPVEIAKKKMALAQTDLFMKSLPLQQAQLDYKNKLLQAQEHMLNGGGFNHDPFSSDPNFQLVHDSRGGVRYETPAERLTRLKGASTKSPYEYDKIPVTKTLEKPRLMPQYKAKPMVNPFDNSTDLLQPTAPDAGIKLSEASIPDTPPELLYDEEQPT